MIGVCLLKKKKFIDVLLIFSVLIFILSLFYTGKIFYDYNKADTTYNKIQNEHIQYNEPTITSQDAENITTDESFEIPFKIDFDSLLNRNEDIVGWLYCPDTVINYPVVKGCDNEKYLHKDIDNNYLISGTLFADYRNGPLEENSKNIIYGHNMKNGTMFAALPKYKEQSYYDSHPIMYYITPQANYKLELFAGLVVKHNDEIYVPSFVEPTQKELLIQYKENSSFKSDVKIGDNDTIMVLSTCSYEFDNARYILIGKLSPL